MMDSSVLFIILFAFVSCKYSPKQLLVDDIPIDTGTIIVFDSSVSVNFLSKNGTYNFHYADTIEYDSIYYNYVFLSPFSLDWPVSREQPSAEYICEIGDTFGMCILNCKKRTTWRVFSDDSSCITVLPLDSVEVNDSTINLFLKFTSKVGGQGRVLFTEMRDEKEYKFFVSYTIGLIESLWVKIDTLAWLYDTSDHSHLRVYLQGTTNAYKLMCRLYGDGIETYWPLKMSEPGLAFNDTIPISFSHMNGVILKQDILLYIYGGYDGPMLLQVNNPMDK
jgi:hypothetical protein